MRCRIPFYIIFCLCCLGCSGTHRTPPPHDTVEVGLLAIDSNETTVESDTAIAIEGFEYLDFAATDFLHDTLAHLSDLIEGHVALVDFWASWCRPCRQIIRDRLHEVYEEYRDQGVVLVGVAVQDDSAALARAIDDLDITWPQLYDSHGEAVDTYNLLSIPHLMLVSANGTVLAWDLHVAAIEAAIDNALAIDESSN